MIRSNFLYLESRGRTQPKESCFVFMAVDYIDLLARYELPDTLNRLVVEASAAIDGKRRQIVPLAAFNELKMRIVRIIEADDMVNAAKGVQLTSQIQDHLFRPIETTAAP